MHLFGQKIGRFPAQDNLFGVEIFQIGGHDIYYYLTYMKYRGDHIHDKQKSKFSPKIILLKIEMLLIVTLLIV